MLSRVRRPLGLLNVSVEQLTELAPRLVAPLRQTDAVPLALMCVGSEALAVAHLRRTLAHVHPAEVKVLVGVDSRVAGPEDVLRLQLVALRENLFLAVEAVLRSRRVLVGLPGAGSQTADPPAVCELSHLILRHVDALPRRHVVAPDVVIVAAQAAKFVLVADGRLDLQEVVAVPRQLDAEMRLDDHLVMLVVVDLDELVDGMRKLDPRPVDFHAQLLSEVDLDVGHLECHRLGPTGMLRLSRVVRHPDRECVIDAVGRQLVFAGALKAEKLSVECLVMGITEHRANT